MCTGDDAKFYPEPKKISPDEYIDLWKYFSDRADMLHDRLWTVGVWLLAMASAIIGFILNRGLIELSPLHISQNPILAFGLACIGILICIYALKVTRHHREHMERNWDRASGLKEMITPLEEILDTPFTINSSVFVTIEEQKDVSLRKLKKRVAKDDKKPLKDLIRKCKKSGYSVPGSCTVCKTETGYEITGVRQCPFRRHGEVTLKIGRGQLVGKSGDKQSINGGKGKLIVCVSGGGEEGDESKFCSLLRASSLRASRSAPGVLGFVTWFFLIVFIAILILSIIGMSGGGKPLLSGLQITLKWIWSGMK